MKRKNVTRQEWENQAAFPVLERTHLADDDFCAGTGLDIRAARKLQADGAFRSDETSTSEGSLRLWGWPATFKASACWAIHEFFALTYPVTAMVVKHLPEELWSAMIPSANERQGFGRSLPTHCEAEGNVWASPDNDWYLVLAGRQVILVSGARLKQTSLGLMERKQDERPIAVLGELTADGYRDLTSEAKFPKTASDRSKAIDLNRANADKAEQAYEDAEAVVSINLSLRFRRCMARAAGYLAPEIWGPTSR